jgi:hypothetical protein
MGCTETNMDEKPYTIEGPNQIRLGPDAKWAAEQAGMTLGEFARYLLLKNKENKGA